MLPFGALIFYTALTPATPGPGTVAEVVVVLTLPAGVVYALARRLL